MKLTLYGYSIYKCGNDVLFALFPPSDSDNLIIKCNDKKDAWRIYSTVARIELDTQNIHNTTSNISQTPRPCAYYHAIKFTPLSHLNNSNEEKTKTEAP